MRNLFAGRPLEPQRNPAIIVVEDEPNTQIILHRVMRDITGGYDIVIVSGGPAALAQFARRPVPLLITDYNMPGMNGLQLTQAVKTLSPSTKIALITAYHTTDTEQRAKDAGVDYYLPKPFPLDHFEIIVRATLI